MRKIVLTFAALAAFGLAIPAASVATSTDAEARTVVVIKKKNRGMHRGWYRGRHEGWRHRGMHRGHGARVIVR